MVNFRLFFSIVFSFAMIGNCRAMDVLVSETKPHVIAINNGLLTIVPGIVARTECGYFFTGRKITSKRFMQDSLINLIVYEENLDRSVQGAGPYEVFCPIVFKMDGRMLKNLGQFDKKKHRELKEALRQNKALYYTYGRGAFIYSLEAQPEENICSELHGELDRAEKETIKLSAQ